MASVSTLNKLNVKLTKPSVSAPGAQKAIEVCYGSLDYLEISLRRTVRVPDNGIAYDLPPDCGAFPIYSVDAYKESLPQSMTAKGGLFIPIYGKFPVSLS